MQNKKYISIIAVVVFAVLLAPAALGVLADQEAPTFANLPVMVDADDVAPLSVESTAQPGDSKDGKIMLDISADDIVISPAGATGGGLAADEIALNAAGYYIYSSVAGTTAHTVKVECTTSSKFITPLTIELADGLNITSETAPINIGSYANVKLVLNNNKLTATGGTKYHGTYAGIRITQNSEVTLDINGDNAVTSAKSAGILVCNGASLTISGEATDKLTVTSEQSVSASNCAAIGTSYYGALKQTENIDTGDDKVFAKLQFDGGQIFTSNKSGTPNIGAYSNNSTNANIIINGGYVSAIDSTVKSISLGRNNTKSCVINGGSVQANLISPVDVDGEALRLVQVTVPDEMSSAIFSFDGVSSSWQTVPQGGKLYLYIPETEDVVYASSGGTVYEGVISGDEEDYTAQLVLAADCTCTNDDAALVMAGRDVVVYTFKGQAEVELSATFTPNDDCTCSRHTPENLRYTLLDSVDSSVAKIDGNKLVVYQTAAGQTLRVQAVASVNGTEYTASAAEFSVTTSDAYVLDIADADIFIDETEISQGTISYVRENSVDEIKIEQGGSGTVSNHIVVTADANITIEGLNLVEKKAQPEYAFLNITNSAKVNLTLKGKNKIDSTTGYQANTYDAPAIYVQGTTLTGAKLVIDGDGSLELRSSGKAPAMGGDRKNSAHGDITINGGKIVAVSSKTAGIGTAGKDSVAGNLVINGGTVMAYNADTTDGARDIKAKLVLNGGSVATQDSAGNTVAGVRLCADGDQPQDSNGKKRYLAELTIEDKTVNAKVDYTVDGAAYQAFSDENGKLYLYLPSKSAYQQICATIGEQKYYKRLQVSVTEKNAAVLLKNPQAVITSFTLPGQGETTINIENHTISVTMPAGVDISSIVPTVQTNGLEYSPLGAQDFSDGKAVEYVVINDDGTQVTYTVTVQQRQLAEGEQTVLDVSVGDVVMAESGGKITVTLGGANIPYNSNGYIITGTSTTSTVDISVSVPITIQNLNLSGSGYYAVSIDASSDMEIAVEGVNTLSAPTGKALYLGGSGNAVKYSFSGENCILNLSGGVADVLAANNVSLELADGVSLFADKAYSGSTDTVLAVLNQSGNKVYPLEVTVDNQQAKNASVKYWDSTMDEGKTVAYLTNASARFRVYRAAGLYNLAVTFGDGNSKVCRGSINRASYDVSKLSVTLGVPKVTVLQSEKTAIGALGDENWPVQIVGKYLGGKIVVTATGQDNVVITSHKVEQVGENTWRAYLNIPNHEGSSDYTYTLRVMVDDVQQTKTATIKMSASLAITSCVMWNADQQVGKTVIDEANKHIYITLPYDLDLKQTPFRLEIEPANAYFFNSMGVVHDQARTVPQNATYQFDADDEDARSYTFTQTISNNRTYGQGYYVDYQVTLTNQPAPKVTAVKITRNDEQTDNMHYTGGKLKLTLSGENFANILNAYHDGANDDPRADQITVVMSNKRSGYTKTYALTKKDIGAYNYTLEVDAPANRAEANNTAIDSPSSYSLYYPVQVYVNGKAQGVGSFNGNALAADELPKLRVYGELEMNANIKSLKYGGWLTYSQEDEDEVRKVYGRGYDEAQITHNGENSVGTIDILVPCLTKLQELPQRPDVELVYDELLDGSNYTFGAKTMSVGDDPWSYTQNVTVTSKAGSTKDYTLTVTRVATEAEQNAEVQSFAYPAGSVVSSDPDLAAADNAEITAKYGYGYNVAQIDHTKGEIKILLPWGTALADVTPQVGLAHKLATYTLTDVGTGDDVTKTQKLTVTAVDGTTKDYTLTITRVATKAEQDATIHNVTVDELLDVSFDEKPNEDGLLPITVTVNRGLELNGLTPALELGHKCTTYTPAGPQDFNDGPVEYIVTAVDGTQLKYAMEIVHKRKSKNNNVKLETTEETREMTAYVTGKEDGNFHPEDVMSRAEAATMLARVHDKFDKTADYATDYVDVPADAWFADYVGFLTKQGVVQGNDKGEFMPTADVSRMEFAAMLARFADLAIDADVVSTFSDTAGTWGEAEIMALVNEGVINGYDDGTFRPHNNLTRAEAVTMVNRLMKRGTTKQELAALSQVANPFGDIDESHWAYSDVISAVTDYSLYVKTETLGKIHDEWVTVTLTGQAE